jgi:alpha-1,6-mannosyltransferase
MHIVQLANFYGPRSGGLRTALHHLGAGYVLCGHKVTLVVPGSHYAEELLPSGVRRFSLPAPRIPGTGGYRAGMGAWARRNGVPSVVISHERLDRLLQQFLFPGPVARRFADVANRRMAAGYDTVVCTTSFARAEFDRIEAPNVQRVPLGVDLATFAPRRRDDGWRRTLTGDADVLIVHCGRLSTEKHVERSVDTVAELTESGVRVRLMVAGDGPRRRALERRARGLPVTFLGFLADRDEVARLLATADVSLAPGPHETFGLAALEALASGTPVVVSASSALLEIVSPGCGEAVDDHAPAFASAVTGLLASPEDTRRAAARARAEEFTWPTSVRGMLAALS